ncbi:signal transduction histidine kinase [Paenochrobactrum gallinarii]|uniref:histidine kinase n=1 Tax=Paenochrobactrum gallinarii TaxID=643673 RepID=A0A841LUV0_9HYPH|nr:PAS domain-containing sensor histidine kinase [Paenochrobactrum gallinarii]MBB6260332.1 signal transduction histidine kinase [Paenochrobactrum gallinarii]
MTRVGACDLLGSIFKNLVKNLQAAIKSCGLLHDDFSKRGTNAKAAAFDQIALTEQAFGGLGFHLDLDGMITDISDHSSQMLGVSRDVLIGSLLLDRVHVSDRIYYLQLMADIRHQRDISNTACHVRIRTVVTRDDHRQSVEHHYFRIHGVLMQPCHMENRIYLTAVASDVQVSQAEELVQLRQDLQDMAASSSHALASLSHELRNPLNAIIGFSDLLLHEMGCRFENEKQRDYAGLIQRSGLYSLDIVNTILDASKIEAGTYQIKPQDFSIREAVHLSMNILAPQAEQRQVILCDRIHSSIGNMIADQRAVQQILINLMANAVKFTPMGGCVTLDGFKDSSHNKQMVFTISDNGVGIAEDDIERLGQPFTQVGAGAFAGSEGVGLGLSLVKALVEKHEGQFEITSRLGKGTIVTIRLPLNGPTKDVNWQQQELIAQAEKDEAEGVTVLNINRLQIGRKYVRQEDQSGEKKQSQERKIA